MQDILYDDWNLAQVKEKNWNIQGTSSWRQCKNWSNKIYKFLKVYNSFIFELLELDF